LTSATPASPAPPAPPAPQVAAAAPADASPPGASPISERDRARQEAFALAVEGLRFDSGTLEVDALGPADPAAAATRVQVGDDLMARNLHVEAIAEFGIAARTAPELAAPYERLGWALLHKGKYAEAVASFRAAVRQDPSTANRLALARGLEMSGERAAAIAALREIVAADPAAGPAHSRLAINLYYAGEYAASWAHVHAARRAGTNPPPQFIPLLEARMSDPGPG
jgi:tetratricopeptide (TPR) repeat protein